MGKNIASGFRKVCRKGTRSQIQQKVVVFGLMTLLYLCASFSASAASLTHSSDNLGTKYGTWGTTYTCATCHIKNSPNIKRVSPTITTPIGDRPVVFDRMSSSLTGAAQAGIGIFGDDQRTLNVNGSQNVCEVCHHNTKYHQFSSAKVATTTHQNRRDCTQCHPHSNAFAATCNTCHGYPPNSATTGTNGQATPATSALQAGQAGAHVAHTSTPFAMQCETCHTGYTATPMGDNRIEIGFGINGANYAAFGSSSSNKGTWYGNSGIAAPYSWRASAPGTTISQSASAESCSVYCHGNWTGANGSIATPSWGITDGSQKACGTCHGASAAQPPTTGSHSRHAGSGSGGLSVACANCHGTVSNNSHVDGKVAWNVAGLAGAPTANYRAAASGNSGNVAPSATFGACATIYCHSNVQGATGSGAPTSTATPVWGAASVTCDSCHWGTGGSFKLMSSGSHRAHVSRGYTFACSACHNGAGSGTSLHADGKVQISMTLGSYTSTTGGFSRAAGKTAGVGGFGSCANTACHLSNLPTWGGTLAANCTGCHDTKKTGTATTLSGKHDKHMNSTNNTVMGLGNGFNCVDCHALVITNTNNQTLANKSLHANGVVNYSSVRGGGSAKYTAATKTCANIYCHSNGNKSSLVYQTPAAWNSATNYSCNGCHGTSGFGAPDYANGGSGSSTPNSHSAHITKLGYTDTTACANCHVKTVDSATANKFKDYTAASYHIDGNESVSFKQQGGKTGTWTPSGATGTCSNTYCHGTAASAAWGTIGPLACNSCHSANSTLPGAHQIHVQTAGVASSYTNMSGNVSTTGSYRFSCGACHSSAKGARHANGPINANGPAEVFYGFTSATMKGGAYNYGVSSAGTDPTGGFSYTGGGNNAGSCNNTYCHSNGQGSNGLTAVAWSTTASSGTCVQCHDTKQTTIASGLSAKHDKHMNPSQNTLIGLNNGFNCKDCHAKTITDAGNLLIADKSKHVNKFVDFSSARGGGSARYNASTKTCSNIYCHSNGNPGALVYVNPTWTGAALTCSGCHGTSGTYYGAPDYANGGPGVATANSHATHITKLGYTDTTGCANCHAKTANATTANKFKDYTASSYHLIGGPRVVLKQIGGKSGSYASSQCSNTYCHGTAASAAWGTVGPLACNSCHSANSTLPGAHQIHVQTAGVASSYTNMSGNVSSAGSYRFSCGACHSSAKGARHANGPINANGPAEVFYGFTSATMKGGAYNYGASSAGTDPTGGFSYTGGGNNAGSCNNTYCHSNGQGSNGLTAVAWSTTTSSGTCVQCHDTKQTTIASGLSAKHDKHMNPSQNTLIGLNNGFNCKDCHAKTITDAGNLLIADKSKHVNKFVDFSSARGGGSARYNASTKTCSNIYCHSNGNPGSLVYVNPTWTGAALSCNGCHGTSGFGAPDYVNGGAGSTTANSHGKHLTALGITDTTGCTICHIKTANPATANKFKDYTGAGYHLNNTPNVYFNKTKAGASATYTAAGTTCSNILCHSNGTGTYQTGLQWGQTDNCGFCHPIASLSATHAKHIDTTLTPSFYSYTANRSTAATYNLGCSNCHPLVNPNHMSGTVLLDMRPAVAGVGALRSKNGAAITAGSVVAGTANSGTTGTSGSSVTCANVYCHSNGYAANLVFATTPNWYGGSFSGDKCANCHGNSPNVTIAGSASHAAHVVAMHYADVYSGTNGLLKAGSSNAPHGSATESTTYNCNICHNSTVTSSANDSNSVCVTCHFSGNTVGATLKGAATIANKANHVNGRVEISFQATSVISKAQLRQASFTGATTVSNYWNRNGSTNYKNGATAFDTAKSALANTMWASGGTCSTTACHSGRSVNWYSDAGKAAQCIMCHTNL